MKTWQAALAHIGMAAGQAAIGVPFIQTDTAMGMTLNPFIQLGVQMGLMFLQVYVAKSNSNTDPNGKQLAQSATDSTYTTSSK